MKEEEKKEENKPQVGEKKMADKQPSQTIPPKRRIVIETDGNNADLVEANVAGNFELVAILEAIAKVVKEKR